MITYWKIRERLLRVPGVANVAIWGERIQMLQVQVDPERLASQRRHSATRSCRSPRDALDVGMLQYTEREECRHAEAFSKRQIRGLRSGMSCPSSAQKNWPSTCQRSKQERWHAAAPG